MITQFALLTLVFTRCYILSTGNQNKVINGRKIVLSSVCRSHCRRDVQRFLLSLGSFFFFLFFADALPRQTEQFWICLCILLPTYLPEFPRLNWDILTKNLVTFKRWDGVKDAKFNVKGVHWKIWFLGGGVTKNQYIGENCLKRENLDSLQV